MSIREQISGTFRSFANIFTFHKKDHGPKNYHEACYLARKQAERDVSPLKIELIKERMSLPSFEAYGKRMHEKEKEIDIIQQKRFDQHLNNILQLYHIEVKK
jgi:hypothetical protein